MILSGETTTRVGDLEEKAGPMATFTIPPIEMREIVNEGSDIVTMIVAMSYPENP